MSDCDPRDQDDSPPDKDDLLYEAWCVIANASDWDSNPEWRGAAERWRDNWHAYLDQQAVPT